MADVQLHVIKLIDFSTLRRQETEGRRERVMVSTCIGGDGVGFEGGGELCFRGTIWGVELIAQAYLFLEGGLDEGNLVRGWKSR